MNRRVWSGVGLTLILAIGVATSETTTIARWSFDGRDAGANSVEGAPPGRLEKATTVDGKDGKALSFQDWSVVDYLKPDPSKATRVVVDHDDRLNPAPPFALRAWINVSAEPIYYGGIVEKGQGFGSSYRLLLLRDMRIEASVGSGHATVRSPAPIELNKWIEVSLEVEDSALVLRLDGTEVARETIAAGTRPDSTAPILIGERFSGMIDDVRLEKR